MTRAAPPRRKTSRAAKRRDLVIVVTPGSPSPTLAV